MSLNYKEFRDIATLRGFSNQNSIHEETEDSEDEFDESDEDEIFKSLKGGLDKK